MVQIGLLRRHYLLPLFLRRIGARGVLWCRLQSQYLDNLSAESHHDHRRGDAGEDGMIGMGRIGRLQPEI